MPSTVLLPDEFTDALSDAQVVAAVIDQQSRLESYWGDLHMQQDKWWRVYNLMLEVGVPDGYNIVYPGTGNAVIETAADHITGDTPLVKVPITKETKGARDQSELLEKWLQASLFRFEEQAESDPVRGVITDLLWAGQVVSHGPLFLPDAWGDDPMTSATSLTPKQLEEAQADYESEKKQNWPFFWRLIDPRYTFADPGTHGRKYVIIKYERYVGEIREQWPEWNSRKPGGAERYQDTERVTWYEYWDAQNKVYIGGRELCLRAKHDAGKPPFQIKGSGRGQRSGDPLQRYRSMLFAATGMIQQEIAAACQRDAVMRNAAWTMMFTPIGSKFKKLEPGKTQPMDPKHIELTKAVTEIKPEVIAALSTEHQWIDSAIQEATYPKVAMGFASGGGGRSSGYLTNSLAALAKLKFNPFIKSAEQVLGLFFADLLNCIEEEVKEDVPVFGPTKKGFVDLSIGPDDIKGNRYVLVKLHPKLPVDRSNEVQLGHMLKADGVLDDDTYIEDYAGYEQPEEMRVRIRRDQIMNSPIVAGLLHLGAAKETGMLTWLAELATEVGMDPLLVQQQLIQSVIGQMQPPAQPEPGAPTEPGTPGAPQAGVPKSPLSPTQQTAPAAGAIPTQSQAADRAGVPRPGAVARRTG